MPVSPGFQKKIGGKKRSDKEMENLVEELYMENRSLKDTLDKLSKRLHAFEMESQNNTMALQQSMRLMRSSSPSPSREARGGPGGHGDEVLRRGALELEEQIILGGKEIERLGKENEKLRTVVGRYRERWEKLKEGAKTRREGGSGKEGATKEGQTSKDVDIAGGRFLAG
jgi:hypothetical protein